MAIYTEPDSASQHVADADTSYLLDGDATRAYLDGDQIIQKAKTAGAQAIIPGYGFLSEDANFARSVAAAGLHFVGPSPESIEQFGLKHTARELALAAGVPVVPGTQGLLSDAEDAARAADGLGYPVMLKSTAGGGGMGLQTCEDESRLRKAFETVQSRGAALFKNAGVFLEKYYPAAHHIEVQVFGNGQGKVAALGERECSIQRRHQKVIEECPSPFVAQKRPDLRKQLCAAAVSLAESVKYASAGTLEFLVDDESAAFFFLEMNTRLQVEHGVTEMVYGVDLVELMLRQADAQMTGRGGLGETELEGISGSCQEPKGHAIEVRVYAENPARDYAPSPGLLQQVVFHELSGTRIDGWVRAGITISPNYGVLVKDNKSTSSSADEIHQIRYWRKCSIMHKADRRLLTSSRRCSQSHPSAAHLRISTFSSQFWTLQISSLATPSHSFFRLSSFVLPLSTCWLEGHTALSKTSQGGQLSARASGTGVRWIRYLSRSPMLLLAILLGRRV